METRVIKINKDNIEKKLIQEAANIIKNGGLVAFPTETVYGLGANGLDENAVRKIFKAKGRPQDNPLILHIHSMEQIKELVREIPDLSIKVMGEFWPGPLTILFKRSSKVPDIITAGLDTVALRMPKNDIALGIIKASNCPIAAPSANTSGRPSPTSSDHVIQDLMGKADMIIDGGITGIGLESTVLDLSGDIPMILRPGGVTLEDLRRVIPDVVEDSSIMKSNIIPKSPGQKYRHYAPNAEMIVFSGSVDNMVANIIKRTGEYMDKGKTVGIMATDETENLYKDGLIISLGSRDNNESIAHNLFKTIRLFDQANVDVILGEGVDLPDLGMAIMNRMMKAASGKVIKV